MMLAYWVLVGKSGFGFCLCGGIVIYCSYKHTPQNVLTPITFELGGVNALKALICWFFVQYG
jgi:hypothetical protein